MTDAEAMECCERAKGNSGGMPCGSYEGSASAKLTQCCREIGAAASDWEEGLAGLCLLP